MSSQFNVVYTVPSNAQTVKDKLRLNKSTLPYSRESIGRVASYTDAISCGAYNGKLQVSTSAVAATGTITLSSMVDEDTVTVNGIVFTCEEGDATGNEFNVGASDTITAVNLAAALNASTSLNVSQAIIATSAAAVVTVTAIVPGTMGNMGTLAISAHGSVSGANLTGGASDALITLKNGQA